MKIHSCLGPIGGLLVLSLSVGCGFISHDSDGKLGVPYYQQEEYNYCVPASIKMWRAYDGLPSVSQTTIWNTLGGPPCSGSTAAFGVSIYTNTGSDAYLDTVYPSSKNAFLSREITSIDHYVPVMVVVGAARNHVGIINGGSYVQQGSTGLYSWQYVFFHDPGIGPNIYYTSDDWILDTCASYFSVCGQVISDIASYAWSSNYQTWGSSTTTYGGESCCNQEYQN